MTLRGHIERGALVLDDPLTLPEGTPVECDVRPIESDAPAPIPQTQALYGDLMEFAGKAVGLPEDAAEQVDHYLYGHAKR